MTFAEVILGAPYQGMYLWELPAYNAAGYEHSLHSSAAAGLPPVKMYCPTCGGADDRNFVGINCLVAPYSQDRGSRVIQPAVNWLQAAIYTCQDCRLYRVSMLFSLQEATVAGRDHHFAAITKVGEFPEHRLHNTRELEKFFKDEDDLELFRKGRQSEALGLGIGAMAYYRRIVEKNFRRLLAKIAKVAEATGDTDMLDALKQAASSYQFRNAVDKLPIPRRLFIRGSHNPLTLLHEAFSDGVHNASDAESLEYAQDGRGVLAQLVHRMNEVLSGDQDAMASVTRLQQKAQERKAKAVAEASSDADDGSARRALTQAQPSR